MSMNIKSPTLGAFLSFIDDQAGTIFVEARENKLYLYYIFEYSQFSFITIG
jgi:hypothetical protein